LLGPAKVLGVDVAQLLNIIQPVLKVESAIKPAQKLRTTGQQATYDAFQAHSRLQRGISGHTPEVRIPSFLDNFRHTFHGQAAAELENPHAQRRGSSGNEGSRGTGTRSHHQATDKPDNATHHAGVWLDDVTVHGPDAVGKAFLAPLLDGHVAGIRQELAVLRESHGTRLFVNFRGQSLNGQRQHNFTAPDGGGIQHHGLAFRIDYLELTAGPQLLCRCLAHGHLCRKALLDQFVVDTLVVGNPGDGLPGPTVLFPADIHHDRGQLTGLKPIEACRLLDVQHGSRAHAAHTDLNAGSRQEITVPAELVGRALSRPRSPVSLPARRSRPRR